jgi:hypothetical protein
VCSASPLFLPPSVNRQVQQSQYIVALSSECGRSLLCISRSLLCVQPLLYSTKSVYSGHIQKIISSDIYTDFVMFFFFINPLPHSEDNKYLLIYILTL